jgi:hypothetical protein
MALSNAEKQAAYRARKQAEGKRRIDLWIAGGEIPPDELAKEARLLLDEMKAKKVWDAVDRELILGRLAGIVGVMDAYEC